MVPGCVWPLGQKASQGAGLCARACSRGDAVSRKPPGGPGHSHKHAGNPPRKHRGSAKHNPGHHKQQSHHGGGPTPVVVKGKHPHHHKARGWSPGSDVACCTAEALGLLLGWGWDEVLALYWRTASDPDAGATITATLEAVASQNLSAPALDLTLHSLP